MKFIESKVSSESKITSLRHKHNVAMTLNTIGFRPISCIGFHYVENSYSSVNSFAIAVSGRIINAAILIFYNFSSFFLKIEGDFASK